MKKLFSFANFFRKYFSSVRNFDDDDNPVYDHECTSWMVFNDLTCNNTNVLHKNRDSKVRNVAVFLSPENSPRKWISLGSDAKANMAMNSSGLAGIMNSGEICIDYPTDDTKKSTPQIMEVIIESCDTAAQAVEKLKEIILSGDYWHHNQKGSIFFFMDTNEGYICELNTKVINVQPYTGGYAVRANIWQNPGMQAISRNNIKNYLNSSARAYIAFSGLNEIMDKYGKISIESMLELSRHCTMPEESPEKRSLCYKRTNSTGSLEIDRQYPGVLSTGYFTVGHPRNTVCIPVPVCAEKILPGMGDYSWSAMSFERFELLGHEAYIPEEWLEFEKNSMLKYSKAKADARAMLDEGKKSEAVRLLNDISYSIWTEASALLEKRTL